MPGRKGMNFVRNTLTPISHMCNALRNIWMDSGLNSAFFGLVKSSCHTSFCDLINLLLLPQVVEEIWGFATESLPETLWDTCQVDNLLSHKNTHQTYVYEMRSKAFLWVILRLCSSCVMSFDTDKISHPIAWQPIVQFHPCWVELIPWQTHSIQPGSPMIICFFTRVLNERLQQERLEQEKVSLLSLARTDSTFLTLPFCLFSLYCDLDDYWQSQG